MFSMDINFLHNKIHYRNKGFQYKIIRGWANKFLATTITKNKLFIIELKILFRTFLIAIIFK
jgi:hypothetical protein